LFNCIYKEACALLGSSALLLKDEKNTATLLATINYKRSDVKWLKNQDLFSLEINLL
jgi:hypothetical protein